MLAFPSIMIDPQGSHEVREGALFSLPAELKDNFRLKKYVQITSPGWSRSEFGYAAFVQGDKYGNRYILPGLYLTDFDPPAKKFAGYKPQFSKSQVETYLGNYIAWEEAVRGRAEAEMTALVHDLRHLSTSIYHSAVEAERVNASNDGSKTADSIKTIIASQTMLKVRIDYLDFTNSVQRFDEIEKIPVFSRVDKVIKCFRASAKHRSVLFRFTGSSYRLASGPNILDIVPYTLIENAVKYAPRNTVITVHVSDTDEETAVEVRSLGPVLLEAEKELIFRRGARGANAIKALPSGTGLGLAVAHNVIEIFKGNLTVDQSNESEIHDGIDYAETSFRFTVPTAGEDFVRKNLRFGRRRSAKY